MLEIPQAQRGDPATIELMQETDLTLSDHEPAEQIAQSPAAEVSAPESSEPSTDPDPVNSDIGREPSALSLLFLMICILFLAAWFVGPRLVEEYQFASTKGKLRAEYENAAEILESQPLNNVSMASQLVAQKVKPSVVSILTRKIGQEEAEIGFGIGRGLNLPEVLRGYGSGVIMSQDGYIVTNAHVIDNSESIRVQLHDRRRFIATEVGRDEASDIAVIRIEADDLTPAQWGDSDSLEVGSFVWAVGSPYRYDQTVTSGIISAKNRVGDPQGRVKNLLQTDAAVNPGSSGGPLVNSNGNVIGINNSIYGEKFLGISFAIQSSTAKFVYEQIVERGRVLRGYLGVQPVEVRQRFLEKLRLPDLEGAMLVQVEPDSPAGLAGLKRLDVVRAWNDIPIHNFNSLYRLAERSTPGTVVEISFLRNGQPHIATVTVGEVPEPTPRLRIEVQQ